MGADQARAAYGRPYVAGILVMLGAILVISFLSLIPPLLIRSLIDTAIPQSNVPLLVALSLAMVAIPLITGLLGVVQRYFNASIGEGVIYDLRVSLFSHLQRMSLRFFTNTKTGELMSRLNNDVGGAQRAVTGTIVDLVTNVVTLTMTLAIMIRLEWRLTLLAVLVLPLFLIPARLLGRRVRAVVREQMTLNSEMNAMMNETLNVSGALLVKLFGRMGDEVQRFSQRAWRVRNAGIKQAFLMRWFFLIVSLVSAVGTALVFFVGGLLVMSNAGFSVGTIVALTAYLGMLYGPLSSLSNARLDFATSMVSFERVFEVIDLPVEVQERPDALRLTTVQGEVCFDDVCFSYQPGETAPGALAVGLAEVSRFGWGGSREPPPLSQEGGKVARSQVARLNVEVGNVERDNVQRENVDVRWALRDVSFEVKPGQLAALVGPSGAGKTTITYLLPRLYDPTEGRITIDGHDLRDLTLDALAQHIGMVTQETYLFNDTIRVNLIYARTEATDAEMEAACRAANIHEFIAELPEGYDSGPQPRLSPLRRREAAARHRALILKDPRILVLDEATSSLDSRSEALIQEALQRIMMGRTSLVIAHRLSTILAADIILVLDHGRLVEHGTHAELLALGGLYATLYETQFRHGLIDLPMPAALETVEV